MGWMSKMFGTEEEVGPEAAHRAAEKGKPGEATHAPARKRAVKAAEPKAAEHKAVPHQATEHAHTPVAHVAAPHVAAPHVAAPHVAAPHVAAPHTHAVEPTATPSHPTRSRATGNTLEHDQMMTVHILTHVPEHAPRTDDPHYHLFEQAKARLKRQGMWKCIINDDLCEGEPELHHTYVEFSQINQVDEAKIQKALGLHFASDEEFQTWAESPGNLEVLCANHHRAHYGIHVIPGPLWEALRFHKTGSGPAAEFVSAGDMTPAQKAAGDA